MRPARIATEVPSRDALGALVGAPFAYPNRTAIIDNGVPVAYRDLEERIRCEMDRIAETRSPTSGTAVPKGVSAARDTTTLVSMLAALLAGVAYCPVDAALPPARRDALISTVGMAELLRAAPAFDDDSPAYVLFTSGSTGSPKPVVTPRRAVAVAVGALCTLFGMTPHDRVLQFAAPSWDTALEEILPALAAGAAVVFDDDAYRGAFPQFLRAVSRQQVTVLNLSTAWWHELVLYLEEEKAALPGCVRLVVIGGEPVNASRLRAWSTLHTGHAQLLNTYGCTETTMITHAIQLGGPDARWELDDSAVTVPVGRPLPHVRERLSRSGELLVSGDCLALGYLEMPGQTADRFRIADHDGSTERWFHTGDLMFRDAHGLLHPVGRVDDQVKVRGVRVHPIEVEAVLSTHPAVAACAVCADRTSTHTSLTAYVVLSSPVGAAELRGYVRERLPANFVPTRVHPVATLCLTSTGKVDRAATHLRFAMAEPEVGR